MLQLLLFLIKPWPDVASVLLWEEQVHLFKLYSRH